MPNYIQGFVGKQFFQLSSPITFVHGLQQCLQIFSQHLALTVLSTASSTYCGFPFLRDCCSTARFSLLPLHAFATLPSDCISPGTPLDTYFFSQQFFALFSKQSVHVVFLLHGMSTCTNSRVSPFFSQQLFTFDRSKECVAMLQCFS